VTAYNHRPFLPASSLPYPTRTSRPVRTRPHPIRTPTPTRSSTIWALTPTPASAHVRHVDSGSDAQTRPIPHANRCLQSHARSAPGPRLASGTNPPRRPHSITLASASEGRR
jgi:hypothetical protein